ncbi:MAG: glycine--tRNA ligase subunit beta, partial [Candidatus Binatia bacterium]
QAVYDQYLPAGSADALPRGAVGRALALADRLDTLVGFFALGLVPTGSKDPFGLRRAALGAVRLILENDNALPLEELVGAAHGQYGNALANDASKTWRLLRPFFDDRVRFLLELSGFAYDEVEAGLRRDDEELADLPALRARVAALHAARNDGDFLAVVLAAKRIANITKGIDAAATRLDVSSLELPEERALEEARTKLDSELERALEHRDFTNGLAAVSRLSPSLEAFFQKVLVMDPDAEKRANRLALLAGLGRSISRLADLSQLVVDKADYR